MARIARSRKASAEEQRLEEARVRRKHWKRWGPYLSERQWGTVREDYSKDGDAWAYFPHDHARSRAYRWGEDGFGGICDRHQFICFAFALWNEQDPFLKERLFGLSNPQGNHGEDVKEYYFYLDSAPTHSYMKFLYKYPQAEFPYSRLIEENQRRDRGVGEFELLDTGIFEESRYFDVFIEYAKRTPEDILIRVTAHNRGPEAASLHLLPTLWFRNTWSWGRDERRPELHRGEDVGEASVVEVNHWHYGTRWLLCEGKPPLLFTENETNTERLFGEPLKTPYVKDSIDACVVQGVKEAVNPAQAGTKVAAHYRQTLAPQESITIRLRLTGGLPRAGAFGKEFERIFEQRLRECDEFFALRVPKGLDENARPVCRV